jgi:hypothetical protein
MGGHKIDTNLFGLKQGQRAFHKLANCFELLSGADYAAFVADIKANGLREPITLFENQILEGRNRYRACLAARVEPAYRTFTGTYAEAAAYVISANIHRRHLTPKQKREAIAELLKANPEQSDRQIAKQIKADHKTVARARAEAEDVGKLPHVETRTDTKGRKQPVKKAATKPKSVTKPSISATITKPKPVPPQVQRELEAKQAHVEELEAAREHDKGIAEQLRLAEIKIIGLESEVGELQAEVARLKRENEALRSKANGNDADPAVSGAPEMIADPKKAGIPLFLQTQNRKVTAGS